MPTASREQMVAGPAASRDGRTAPQGRARGWIARVPFSLHQLLFRLAIAGVFLRSGLQKFWSWESRIARDERPGSLAQRRWRPLVHWIGRGRRPFREKGVRISGPTAVARAPLRIGLPTTLDPVSRGREYFTEERRGYRTVSWRDGRVTFGLVSPLDEDLLHCADGFAKSTGLGLICSASRSHMREPPPQPWTIEPASRRWMNWSTC
jgi:hypothetical protein